MVHLHFFPYPGIPGHNIHDPRLPDEYEAIYIAPQKKSVEMALRSAFYHKSCDRPWFINSQL